MKTVSHTQIDDVPVFRVGLGCSNFGKRIDEAASREVVHAALDHGVNFFDVADVYGGGTAEGILGRALGDRRDEVLVATKFGHATSEPTAPNLRGGHPDNVRRSIDASLRALGTDRVDLYQLHEPDPRVPIADTLGALAELVAAGKVRWVGCSNMSADQIREADTAVADTGATRFRTVQNEYSLLVRDAEVDVLPLCRKLDLGFIPYFPFASGVLTGKYSYDQRPDPASRVARMKPDKLFRFFTPTALDLVERLRALGVERGRSVLQLARDFLLAEPTVLAIIAGAMTPEQVATNVADVHALDDETLGLLRGHGAPDG